MLLISLVNKAWSQVHHWREVSTQRRQLNNMSDHLLKDIGLSRVDAEREAKRPFWDVDADRDTSLRTRGRLVVEQTQTSEGCKLKCCSQN